MGIGRFLTPEWRAGTQIAIITERSGPNILDFLFIDIPQISIGFLDAIKVSTHVNLEFDVDFIVAMAEAALGPLNTLSNNLSNSIGNIQIQDIDLTNALPQNVNVKVELDGSTRRELNYGPTKKLEAPLVHYVKGVVNGFLDLTSFMRSHSSEEVSVDGMREILRSNIVLLQSFGDARATSIANEIKTAVAYNGAREDAIIASMTKESQERFDALRSLIKDESEKTKLLKQAIDDAYSTREATLSPLLGYDESDAILASDRISVSPNIERINASNERIITSLENLITHPDDPDRSAIQTLGSNIKKNVSDGLLAFAEEYQQQERLLADITPASSSLTPSLSGASLSTALASPSASSSSKYVYEGIYYRDSALGQTLLTDYTKEYDGSESVVAFRRDGPSQTNEDVIVRVGDSLYLKEHLNATDRLSPVHETGDPAKQSLDSVVGITSEVSLPLSSPSSFSEVSSAPGQVTFSFRPFDQEHDRTFRLEYEETPTRFDEKEASIDRTTPTSRRRVYDLAVDDLNEDVVTIHPGGIIEKKYAHITDAQGAGIVRMRSWVSHQHTFTLNAGDTLYSLDGNVRALVRSVSSKSSTPFTFAKGASYVMSETTEIRIT